MVSKITSFVYFKSSLFIMLLLLSRQESLMAQSVIGGKATANPSTICTNHTSVITLTGNSGGNSVRWQQTDANGIFQDISEPGLSFTTPNLTFTTSYRAIVSNGGGKKDTSTIAIVTVSPTSVGGTATATTSTICAGGSTTINLSGNLGTIQWQSNASGSYVDIPGATSATYTTPFLTTTTSYQAIVTSGACSSAISTIATVTVSPTAVGGTATATPSAICSGGTSTITLASNTGSIQWQTNASGSFVDIPGETASSYATPTLTTSTSYKAIVTSGTCSSAISNIATVTISPTSVGGTATATPSTICAGGSTTINVSGNTGIIQWQTNASGSYVDIAGATNATYTTPSLTTTTSYRAIITSGGCSSAISSIATVTVSPTSVGGTATATPSTICSGATSTITLASNTGSIQWQTNASGSFVDIPGETASSYATPTLTTSTSYKAIVSSGVCASVSNIATVTVSLTSVGGTATATPSTICGGATSTITLTSNTGSIQWQTNASGSYVDIAGATNATYTTPSLTTTTSYRAIVTSGNCTSAISSIATVTVLPTSVGGAASAIPSTICSGATSTITLSSNTGSIQWQTNASGSYVDIAGATNATYTTPSLTTTTSYQAIVTSGGCSSAISNIATVTVSPTSVGGTATATPSTICSGATSTITLASNTGSIQWQTNASGSYVDIPGATSGTYTTPSLTTTTSYRAIVTSGTCSSAISNIATITVSPNLVGGTATATPSTICSGATSTVTLTSNTGSVQWQTNASGSYVDIPGATSGTYTTPSLTNSTSYRAIVTSGGCASAISSIATVTVSATSVGGIATATPSTICSGATSTITLTSNTGSVQWQTNASGSYVDIAGATSGTYTTPSLITTTSYQAIVTSGGCASAISSIATVTVSATSVGGTATATPSTICGGATSTITLTSNTGSIQWQTNASGSYVDIAGATSGTYTTPSLITTTSYRAIVTSGTCSSAISNIATVKVSPTSGGGTAAATISSICNGGNSTIILASNIGNIQWQTNASGSYVDIPGAINSSYITPTLNVTTSYRAIVTSGACPPAISSIATVTVSPTSVGGIATAASSSVCSGGTTIITLTSYTGSIQWQTNASGSFVNIAGATGASYTTPALTTATSYKAIVTSGVCVQDISTTAVVSIVPALVGGTATASPSTVCNGGPSIITLTGNTGSIQWQTNASGSFVDIPGATGSSYNTPPLTTPTSYKAIVSSGACATATSSIASISIVPASVGGTTTASMSTICNSGSTIINLSSYTGTIQWQSNASGSFTDIAGATSASYTTLVLTTSTSYRAIVTNGACSSSISSIATITVFPTSVGGTAAATTPSICSGNSATIVLASYTGTIQWQSNASGSFVNIPGATNATYITPTLTNTTSYKAIVTSGVCAQASSTIATVSIAPPSAGGTATAVTSSVCSGGSTTINLTSYTGSIQWQTNASGTFVDIPGATGASYPTPSLTTATSYRAIVTSGTCGSSTSTIVSVSVSSASVGGIAAATAPSICSGSATTIVLASYTGSIQWQTNASGSFVNIPSATSASYTTPNLTTTTSYKAIVTNGLCSPATSTIADVVIAPPSIGGTTTATPSTICSGGSTTINLTSYTGNIQWQTNASGSFVNIPGATGASYPTPSLTIATSYRAIVTSGTCAPVTSSVILISISPNSVGGTATAIASTICAGGSTTVNVSGNTGIIQWQTNASGSYVDIPGATSATYTTPSLTTTTSYRAILTSGGCSSAISSIATVTVSPTSVGGTATAASSSICIGGTTIITLTSYTGSIQWQTNASGSFVNIAGATGASYTTPTLTTATSYKAIVTSGVCVQDISTTAVVSIVPVLVGGTATASPSTVCNGGTSTITLTGYTGSSIQWQTNASGSFVDIPGATGSSYNTPPLTTPTSYKAIVSSGVCAPATSTIVSISTVPVSVGGTATALMSTICNGGSTIINLTSYTGTIQWQSNASGSFTDIAGATSASYTTLVLTTSISYRAIVTSGACSSISSIATVTVFPTSVGGTAAATTPSICSGSATTIVLASYTGTIQWQSNASGSFVNIPGATNATYTTPTLITTTSYQAIVTSGVCAQATSTIAAVSIAPPSAGGTATAVTSSVCSGGSTTINLTSYTGNIQWQTNASGSFVNIPGATGASYPTASLTIATSYRAIVTSGTCAPATSSVILISISPNSVGGTATALASTICAGGSTTINVSGNTGIIQWQTNTLGSYVDIPGAINSSYTTPTLNVTTSYRAIVTSGSCSSAISSIATVTVSPSSVGGTATAASSSICSGGTTIITLTSYTGSIQWQTNASGSFVNIAGATGASYTTPPLTTATSYKAIVTSGVCVQDISTTAVVSIVPALVGGTATASPSAVCNGGTSTITLIGYIGSSIQWQTNASGSFLDIPGATSASYITPNLSVANSYKAIVSSGACPTATSTTVTIIINKTSIPLGAATQNFCAINNPTLGDLVVTGSAIKWYSSAIGGSPLISSTQLTNGTSYFASQTLNGCESDDRFEVVVSFNSSPSITIEPPLAVNGCIGSTISFSVTATGIGLSYQWMRNTGSGYVNLIDNSVYSGSSTSSLTLTNINSGMNSNLFKCIVNGICPNPDTSRASMVSILIDCISDIFIPTGFSPDGDGINDFLVIKGIEKYSGSVLKVYNRWGDIVYEKTNYKNDWDGTSSVDGTLFNGKLPVGTYFTYLDFNNGAAPKLSYLIIKY